METSIYIVLVCILVGLAHVVSAVKSGCFYAAARGAKPKLLGRFMDDLHYVQTPFWYALFGSMFVGLFAIMRVQYPDSIWTSLLCAYLITQGTSTAVGPIYQGFVNVGAGRPFTDSDEKRSFEFAVPILNKSVWIPKFWYGRYRWFLVPIGIAMVVTGISIWNI